MALGEGYEMGWGEVYYYFFFGNVQKAASIGEETKRLVV